MVINLFILLYGLRHPGPPVAPLPTNRNVTGSPVSSKYDKVSKSRIRNLILHVSSVPVTYIPYCSNRLLLARFIARCAHNVVVRQNCFSNAFCRQRLRKVVWIFMKNVTFWTGFFSKKLILAQNRRNGEWK